MTNVIYDKTAGITTVTGTMPMDDDITGGVIIPAPAGYGLAFKDFGTWFHQPLAFLEQTPYGLVPLILESDIGWIRPSNLYLIVPPGHDWKEFVQNSISGADTADGWIY